MLNTETRALLTSGARTLKRCCFGYKDALDHVAVVVDDVIADLGLVVDDEGRAELEEAARDAIKAEFWRKT